MSASLFFGFIFSIGTCENIRTSSKQYQMAFPSVLISWIDGLHQNGQTSFALPEALAATGLSRGAFLDAAERLQRKERLHRVRNGFYVPIRESRRNVGAPSFNVPDTSSNRRNTATAQPALARHCPPAIGTGCQSGLLRSE